MNKKILLGSLALMTLLLLSACSTSKLVRPLAKDEIAVGLDFGGPIIDFAGAKIPIPLTSLTGAYGIDSTFTAYGSLHTTDLAFGTLHLEGGVLKEFIAPQKQWIPGLSASFSGHFMLDFFEARARAYPQLNVNAYWQYLKKHPHFFYVTWISWLDLWTSKAHNQPNDRLYIPSVALGHTFQTKKWRYTIEAKWLAPFEPSQNLVVRYNGIAGQGSLGVYFSIYRSF